MARCIDADKFKKYILDRYNTMEMVGINQVIDFIKQQPTADVKPVVRSKWIQNGIDFNSDNGFEMSKYTRKQCSRCKECGYRSNVIYNYCPNCGADMRTEVIK